MGLVPKFTKADIRKQMEAQMQNIEKAILSRLEYVGQEFVKMAREKTASTGGFNDITGNLRSSIGFVVLKDGRLVSENFEIANSGSDKTTGLKEAKRFANELKNDFATGYALIVVAGMDYAAAVENRHHKDVITGSSLIAEANLRRAMQRLKDKVGRL